MKPDRKILIVIILLAGFIFGVSFSTLYVQTHVSQGTTCSCTLPISILIPSLSSLGVFIGSLVYYMLYPKIEEDKKKRNENIERLMEILPKNEGDMIKMLIKNRGETTQNRLSSEFGRVRTFRIIERLRKRGVLEKVPYGKTNTVRLSEKFRQILAS